MDAEHLSSLRQAATALINTAPAPTVLAALRALLADPAFGAAAPLLPLRLPQSAPEPVRAQTPQPAPVAVPRAAAPPRQPASAAQPVVDAAWDELRGRVKAAMAERGASYADVAIAIRRSEIATRIAVGSRKPPPLLVRVRLQEWLVEAPTDVPEVAAYGTTFPGNGTSRVHTDSFGTAD